MVNPVTEITLNSIHKSLSYLGRNLGIYEGIQQSRYMTDLRQYLFKNYGLPIDTRTMTEVLVSAGLPGIISGPAGYGIGYNAATSYGFDEETAQMIGVTTGGIGTLFGSIVGFLTGKSIANKANDGVKSMTHYFDVNRMKNNNEFQPVDKGDPINTEQLLSLVAALQNYVHDYNLRRNKTFVMNNKHATEFINRLRRDDNQNAMIALIRLGVDNRDMPEELVDSVLNQQTQIKANSIIESMNTVLPPQFKQEIQDGLIEDLKIASDERSGRRKLK